MLRHEGDHLQHGRPEGSGRCQRPDQTGGRQPKCPPEQDIERQLRFGLLAWIGEFYFSIAYVMLVWLQGGLQPFRWQKHDSVPHRGQPDVFDFQFELMKPWS